MLNRSKPKFDPCRTPEAITITQTSMMERLLHPWSAKSTSLFSQKISIIDWMLDTPIFVFLFFEFAYG